jgi:UDP-N-acetylglucosamine 1-carboxyvinyltransferase
VNLHLEGLKALGAKITLEEGYIIANAPRLKGGKIALDFPSVGATGNLLMAAVLAKGETVIKNAAREPDIAFLAEFLNGMGAKIEGVGESVLKIQGVDNLTSCSFNNIPDRIEAGTFLIAGAISEGDITLTNCQPNHCDSVIDRLTLAGCTVETANDSISIRREDDLQPVDVTTGVYPGYPTDLQAQWIALMSLAKGVSRITDHIYHDRFTHVAELMRLGADIRMKENTAIVKGSARLKGAQVMSTDIRASASLILAGLAAEGRTDVSRIYHIDRGYYKIEEKLRSIGGDIERRAGTL